MLDDKEAAGSASTPRRPRTTDTDRSDRAPDELAVCMRGVTVTFGDTVALDEFDLEMPPGIILGLLGPNGSGKTTAVKVLATLLRPDRGVATVFGHDVVHDAAATRRRVALAGQYAAVDELLTGTQNLEMFGQLFGMSRRDARRRAGELLERFELTDAAGRAVEGYSGGMRRRLDLASSLLTDPELLFLDEPTTGLDPRSRATIWSVIRDLAEDGASILLTTQYLDEADALADSITVMDRGAVIASGTATELKDEAGGLRIEVELAERGDIEAFRTLVADRFGDQVGRAIESTRRTGGRILIVDAGDEPLARLAALSDAVGEQQFGVRSLGVRGPDLDDVFFRLTGDAPAERREDGTTTDDAAGEIRP